MAYVDGFVLAVPKKKLDAYKRLARIAAKVWRDHGALDYRECVGDDLRTKCGLPFPKLARLKAGEAVVFAWISYKSRAHRDRVNAKVMKDKRIIDSCDPKDMPFDVKRMTHGGFRVMVAA
jgi:uncharacterized protein YbaA (DUF1428 family)